MSYSTLKAFDKDGNVLDLEEFSNSRFLPVIWDALAEKYGIIEKLKREIAKAQGTPEHLMDQVVQEDGGIHYGALGRLRQDMRPVWDLQHNPALTREDWYALMFTFDNMVVPPELIERVAQAFENIKVAENFVDHGASFARCMRTAVKEVEGIRGIALHGTSICDDPWWVCRAKDMKCPICGGEVDMNPEHDPWCDACDKYVEASRPYNLDLDDDHHFLPTREAHRKMEDGA